jgi:hypothetical protein
VQHRAHQRDHEHGGELAHGHGQPGHRRQEEGLEGPPLLLPGPQVEGGVEGARDRQHDQEHGQDPRQERPRGALVDGLGRHRSEGRGGQVDGGQALEHHPVGPVVDGAHELALDQHRAVDAPVEDHLDGGGRGAGVEGSLAREALDHRRDPPLREGGGHVDLGVEGLEDDPQRLTLLALELRREGLQPLEQVGRRPLQVLDPHHVLLAGQLPQLGCGQQDRPDEEQRVEGDREEEEHEQAAPIPQDLHQLLAGDHLHGVEERAPVRAGRPRRWGG